MNRRNFPPWFEELRKELEASRPQPAEEPGSTWKKVVEFASAHFLFVLASAIGPLVSHGIGLPTPHPTAPYIAFILCALGTLTILAAKDTLAFWSAHGTLRCRLLPFVITTAFAILGLVSFSAYLMQVDPDGRVTPGLAPTLLFLLIWPSFTASGWTLLAILFFHFGSSHRQRAVLALLNKYYHEEHLLRLLEQMADYKQLAEDVAVLEQLGLSQEEKMIASLNDLHQGKVRVDPKDVGPTFMKVADEYRYYDGVSACELKIWLPDTDNRDAGAFFTVNERLVRRGAFVCTRVFIVRRDDLEDLEVVLRRHASARIGWAVVLYEDLPYELQQRVGSDDMHFGLFDGGRDLRMNARKAYAQFHLVDRNPHMTLGFRTQDRGAEELERHSAAYEQLVSLSIWMDTIFRARHARLFRRFEEDLESRQGSIQQEIDFDPKSNQDAVIVSTGESIARDFSKFKSLIRISETATSSPLTVLLEESGKREDAPNGGIIAH